MNKSYFAVVSFGRNPLKGRFFHSFDAARRALFRAEENNDALRANGRIHIYSSVAQAKDACISDRQP